MIDISVIIVSWNAKKFLLRCLNSLLLEENSIYMEIIVVDNASTDGSPETVKEQFPHVNLIINKKNLGFSKANNIGIRNSIGRYVCLINSDIELLSGCIKRLFAYIEKNPSIGILGPCILNSDLKLQSSCRRLPNIWNTLVEALFLHKIFNKSKIFSGQFISELPQNKVSRVEVISGCFWIVRREAINQVGLLDENYYIYGEDVDWCKRFGEAGWKIIYYPFAKAIHYEGASSANAPVKFYIEMQRAKLQYWKKYYKRFPQTIYWLITLLFHINRIMANICVYIIKPFKKDETIYKLKRSAASIKFLLNISD